MNFTKIDLDTWHRAVPYRHFTTKMRCVMSMTAEIDVTDFLAAVREKGYKFYPAMMWAVTAAVNCREELRMGRDAEGNPGIWDQLWPYYAHFHPEDQGVVKLVTAFSWDCGEFCRRFQEDLERYADKRWFEVDDVPPNVFDLSCLPWTHYKNFDIHVFDDGTYLGPIIVWGKYEKNAQGRINLPLTLNIHHAAADGYHLCRFFDDVKEWMRKV